jgi:large subunit ribosomal protein L28
MAKVCDVCGKGLQSGQNIRHVHSGAWARKAPRTKRVYHPNLQTVTVETKRGKRRLKICAKCLKKGTYASTVA